MVRVWHRGDPETEDRRHPNGMALVHCRPIRRLPVVYQRLLAETQSLDRVPILFGSCSRQESEEAVAPPHHLEKASPRSVVLPVDLEVLVELLNSGRENRNLDFGRSSVGVAPTEVNDDLCL